MAAEPIPATLDVHATRLLEWSNGDFGETTFPGTVDVRAQDSEDQENTRCRR